MTPVANAMATKLWTKSAITRLIYEISRRSLRITGVFGVGLLNDATNSTVTNLGTMATKFGTKSARTRLYKRYPGDLCA